MEMKLFDTKKTLELEKKIKNKGTDPFLLMLRAGNEIIKLCDKYKYKKIISIAGPGNNGGDALAASFFGLLTHKEIISINLTKKNSYSSKLIMLLRSINAIINKKLPLIRKINKDFIIIDGVLGIGLNRPPEGKVLSAINWINKAKTRGAKIISIDVPSGLNADIGVAYKSSVNASSTMMCLSPKKGCYTGDGLIKSGDLLYNSLNIDINKFSVKSDDYLLDTTQDFQLERNNLGYKGSFGSVLIIGGWDGMEGAANLCAKSAFKTGAGKVFLCNNNPTKKIDEVIHIKPEKKDIKRIIDKINVIVAGPGIDNNGFELLNYIWNTKVPLVLDADALIWLANNFKKKRKELLICTPHNGEAKELLKKSFKNRFNAITQLKNIYGGNWILKGPGTLIQEKKLYVNNFASSILSTAGTGDILAGIIGGLIAQKIKEPLKTAVSIQTRCAKRILIDKKTIRASELIEEISRVLL